MKTTVLYLLLLAGFTAACNGSGKKPAGTIAPQTTHTPAPATKDSLPTAADSVPSAAQPQPDSATAILHELLEELVLVQPRLKIVEDLWDKPAYQTPAKHISVSLTADSAIRNTVYTFYYSPRMPAGSYPYRQHLGKYSYNNFVGTGTRVSVPDTTEPGATLMLRAIGYEPLNIPVDSLPDGSRVSAHFVPKTYTAYILLQDTDSGIAVSLYSEQPTDTTFYGDCLPIYYRDGSHGDPICAFSCMACCYPTLAEWQVQQELHKAPKELKRLYRSLQQGDSCSFVLSTYGGKPTVEPETLPDIRLDQLTEAMRTTEWRIHADAYNFRQRIIFATYDDARRQIRQRWHSR